MHITVDERGSIEERGGALLESYLGRLDLTRSAKKVATLVVERGLVRADHLTRAQLVTALAAGAEASHAVTARAWMDVARTTVRLGWTPSKWALAEATTEEVHVHVHQGWPT